MVKAPIYKDTYYTTSADTQYYRILVDGEVVYSGKAVKMPDADLIHININRVCRNYLDSNIVELLETSATTIINYNACRTFNVVDQNQESLEDYMFLLDYSYSSNWNGTNATLSSPINNHFISGQLKLKTTVASSIVVTNKTTGDYSKEVCGDVVLYYLNANGGWDSFAIEGTVTKKDTLTSFTTDRAFNNTTVEFETNRYISEIKTSYVLNTGYLSDVESEKLAKHLLSSNKVYMHNLKEGWIKPIVIDDTQITYQTYKGNNKKMSTYKINVKESQSKIRK